MSENSNTVMYKINADSDMQTLNKQITNLGLN